MRFLIISVFLFSNAIEASDFTMEIEKRAASLSGCTIERPCVISIEKTKDQYVAIVRSSSLITEYGVLKFRTGSVTYYTFDMDGQLLGSRRTT